MNEVRIGRVSGINDTAGTIRVSYSDRTEKDTAELPVFCGMGREYQMPKVGDQVLVLHLSNDSSMGVAMGGFWTDKTRPQNSGPGVYYKSFQPDNSAYLQAFQGALSLCAGSLTLQDASGSISLSEILAMKRKVDTL